MDYANGEKYEGRWLQGKKEGEGIYTRANVRIRGIWEKGLLKH